MQRTKQGFIPIIILLLVVILVSGIFLLVKNKTISIGKPFVTSTPIPTPTMEKINYKTQNLGNGWIRVISDNYHFQFDYPQKLNLTSSLNFSHFYPQNESVTMRLQPNETILPEEPNHFTVDLNLTASEKNVSNDLKDTLEKQIQQGLAQENIISSSDISPVSVGNVNGYVHTQIFAGENYNYEILFYDAQLDNSHRISFAITSVSPTITAQDLPTIHKIIQSFKFQ